VSEALLEAALAYADAGLFVFPLKRRSKVPATIDGFKSATRDHGQIREWWRLWPEANIGIRTGRESGLVVLDVDVQHGGAATLKALEAEHGALPDTARTLTGGGGNHYLFAHPGSEIRNSSGTLGPGLDVRADSGYIVAPPSIHENGRAYMWLHKLEHGRAPAPALLRADAARRRNGRIDEIIPEGQRRAAMLTVAGKLKRAGLSGDEIIPTLRKLNERCRPPLDELELDSVAYESTIAVDPDSAIPTAVEVDAKAVDDVLDVFRHWLHLPDPSAVLVTCATIAANRVETFDPTWLVLVGAAGSGKTEALNATSKLDGVHVAATITEAALLSGTPRKDAARGATGGLLRTVGEAGVIVLKDFGSVLSMHRDARAGVIAALRELYDGSWTRLVGVDGGRRLHWEGRLGLLAGATTVIDQHHAVMAQLGERFLIHRLIVDDAAKQGRSSLAHHGREQGMRRELAEAVAALFTGLQLNAPPPLSESDIDRLVALAELVARSRSPVIRDAYRREIELVPDSEAPGRIVGALARLLTGLRLIGIGEAEAWRVTVKTGLDSMPAARRQALELLVAIGSATTTDAATTLGLPSPTTRRVLQDLAAHRVLQRESQGEGKADLWRIEPWVTERHREATFSEKSEGSIS
jgi:Bifunctional DNA primase/polymerase, N-terminal